ncbi:MAG: hypothetical protein JWQ38_1550 [Flavipsychrobacter sp.]|nr:hypothetical protein [Flavipsychrobacter sp.]
MKKRWTRKIPFVIAIAALGVFAFTSVVMLLWNGILPAVLHVGAITFWQAAGILLLSKILFSGFRGRRGMHGGGWGRRIFAHKLANMTDEEKEQFRNGRGCHSMHDTACC